MNIQTLMKILIPVVGSLVARLYPTYALIIVCTIAVLMDCYTAWRLSVRVKNKFPGSNDGKFKSEYARKLFTTLIKVYALIVLAFLIDEYIIVDINFYLPNIVAGAFCFVQVWSILENESSCSGSRWARIGQRILVDKTERHLDIELPELKTNKEDEKL